MNDRSSLNRLPVSACLVGVLASPAWSQSTAKVLAPPILGTGFGYCVADLGDIDGDNVHDIAVGAPGDQTAGVEAGAFHVYSGATATILYTVLGPGPVSFFGRNLTVVGDVNFDGKNDFIERRLVLGTYGLVTLYSSATGQPLFTVDSAALGIQDSQFGFASDTYGDFDSDGRADILVSAPGASGGGTVFILSGANGAVLQSVSGGTISGLGSSVAALGHVDLDSVPDFAATGFQGSQRVAVVFSGATGTVLNSFSFPSAPALLIRAADFNADGRRDLLVARAGTSIEVLDVITGAALVAPLFPPACEQSTVLCATCTGFATDVQVLGDRDGDGVPDLAEFNARYMRWSILSSVTGLTQFHFADANLPWSATGTNDWDGDGKSDLIVGFRVGVASRVVVASGRNPIQGTPIARGDGTGAACPCGNFGQAGAGCANSSGLGATLRAKGSTSLATNNLALETTGIAPGAYSMLISGSSAQAGGLGVPFRDGLLAAGGTITRVKVQLAACTDGMVFGPGLSPQGAPSPWTAGNTYALQVWYRDSTGPCGQASNLTNGTSLSFTP